RFGTPGVGCLLVGKPTSIAIIEYAVRHTKPPPRVSRWRVVHRLRLCFMGKGGSGGTAFLFRLKGI
ncbi:MAG: hypothetical protein IJ088_12670, partial [Clostridia bacterium]|nr:hypothetical protein [Clostridia bacterium]